MDHARKNQLEQKGVLVLLGLFGIVILGSLKSMGVFGSRRLGGRLAAHP